MIARFRAEGIWKAVRVKDAQKGVVTPISYGKYCRRTVNYGHRVQGDQAEDCSRNHEKPIVSPDVYTRHRQTISPAMKYRTSAATPGITAYGICVVTCSM